MKISEERDIVYVFPRKKVHKYYKPGLKVFIRLWNGKACTGVLYFKVDQDRNFIVEDQQSQDALDRENIKRAFATWFLSIPGTNKIIWSK